MGLTSLKEISRGNLTIVANQHLERLGLVSLESIGDGSIIIRKNTKLCYIESINWTQISASRTRKTDVINNANQISFCGRCLMILLDLSIFLNNNNYKLTFIHHKGI